MYRINLPLDNGKVVTNYNKINIHIVNSFRVKTTYEMSKIIFLIKGAAQNRGIIYPRSNKSLIREWKAHNVLYFLGIKRNRTRSVDLNQNESVFRRIGYFVLSLFYWK